jgi:hypothetical protein
MRLSDAQKWALEDLAHLMIQYKGAYQGGSYNTQVEKALFSRGLIVKTEAATEGGTHRRLVLSQKGFEVAQDLGYIPSHKVYPEGFDQPQDFR